VTELADTTLVDSRYRILGRIGSGGMADVYRAEDTHLRRDVAIKVLHRRFAQDQEFVERFRREASSAAGLQHPNVVGVFDRGQHEGTYYIAMEHLEGRSLKEIVSSEAPLPQETAIDLGIQILRAAGFAHRRGVIHRDFKPHNVIVDEAGIAKVTDFGIARAGSSEITETGSIMGTAQYLSPEQAEGHAVTAASDLYSIGVMLYEMLTGRLPFDGDSAVSIALKHLTEPPPPLSHFRPDVSPTLEAVVMAALAKTSAERWQSAEDFASALETARSQLGLGDGQDTAAWAPVPVALPVEAPEPGLAEPLDGDEPPPPDPARRRRRRWPMVTIGLMTLVLAGLLAYLALAGLLAADKVEVPRVVNKQLVQARASLERAGFKVKEARVRSSAELDTVIDQDPNGGVQADKGSTVELEVSRGPGDVRVPSIENLPQAQAVRELNKAHLKVNLDEEHSDRVREGFAIRTVPKEGTLVTKDTRIRLFVSSGPAKVTVPDVVGLSRESAETQLGGSGLEVAVREQESDRTPGEVLAQSPAGGTHVDKGTRVTITVAKAAAVAKGKPKVTVPDVLGLSDSEAVGRLRRAKLSPATRERAVTSEDLDGQVLSQSPGAGVQADQGDTVAIVVGKFKKEETTPTTPPPRAPPPPPG
jgi:beta-lactam-binding protein with PASTA domain/tRNA A-37 threonylcarbamoyl transferase component Bud32